jgi:hypothetical protein
MQPEDLQTRWNAQGEEIFAAVAQWRAAHPQATLAEIEIRNYRSLMDICCRMRRTRWCA